MIITTSILGYFYWGFSGSSDNKKSAHSAEDPGLIPGLGRSPGEGNGYPLHRPRSLVGYSPRGHKESNVISLSKKNSLVLISSHSPSSS